MDKTKVGLGEPQYAEAMNKTGNVGVVESEGLNRFINGWFKAENLKSFVLEWIKVKSSISSQSLLTRFKLLALAVTTMLMMLVGALLLEFTALGDTMRPRLLTLRASNYIGLFGPPESKCTIYIPGFNSINSVHKYSSKLIVCILQYIGVQGFMRTMVI